MDNSRTARQATRWELRGYKRKPGRPRKNWVKTLIKRDLRQMDLTWEEAEELANDKAEWRRRVANAAIWMRDELRSRVGSDKPYMMHSWLFSRQRYLLAFIFSDHYYNSLYVRTLFTVEAGVVDGTLTGVGAQMCGLIDMRQTCSVVLTRITDTRHPVPPYTHTHTGSSSCLLFTEHHQQPVQTRQLTADVIKFAVDNRASDATGCQSATVCTFLSGITFAYVIEKITDVPYPRSHLTGCFRIQVRTGTVLLYFRKLLFETNNEKFSVRGVKSKKICRHPGGNLSKSNLEVGDTWVKVTRMVSKKRWVSLRKGGGSEKVRVPNLWRNIKCPVV